MREAIKPFFLDGPNGRLFATYFGAASTRAHVLHLPAAFDEMNKSRHVVAKQARALSEKGYGVLVVDPFGTGDSEGEFGDASWTRWRGDFGAALQWLRERFDAPIALWGLRLGGLMALDLAAAPNGPEVSRLLLWQPVLDGRAYLRQVLRLRVASKAIGAGGSSESTADLLADLERGRGVEVGGYMVGAELAAELNALNAETLVPARAGAIDIFHVAAEGVQDAPPALLKVTRKWQAAGTTARIHIATGDAFWSTQELSLNPALQRATTEVF